MKKRITITAIILVLLAFVLAGVAVFRSNQNDQANIEKSEVEGVNTVQYQDPTTGLTVDYPSDLEIDSARKKPELFRISNSPPSFSVLAQYEEGDSIRKLKTLGADVRETIVDNVKKQLPATYNNVEVLEERVFEQHGHRAAEIKFSYINQKGTSVTQRLLVLIKNDSLASYIVAQASTKDFDSLNDQYLTPILSSLRY